MAKLQYAAVLVWAATVALVAISHLVCRAQGTGGAAAANAAAVCRPSSCGDVLNISTPFRLLGDSRDWDCAGDRMYWDPWYELKCVANRTILELPYSNRRFWVKAIWYEDMVIQVIEFRAIDAGPSDLSPGADIFYGGYHIFKLTGRSAVEEISCCSRGAAAAAAAEAESGADNLYWLMEENWTRGHEWGPNDLPRWCRRVGTVPYLANCSEVRDAQMQVFNLTWDVDTRCDRCMREGHLDYYPSSIRCFFCTIWYKYIAPGMTFDRHSYSYTNMRFNYDYFLVCVAWLLIIVRTSIGYIALLAFLVFKLRRRLLDTHDDVEMFLTEYRNCMPTRYTYRQIKKMTGSFKEKLGQGGFGSVFKGKQLTGRPVAIKILSKSDSNGKDFINEVATIGRIHHANVVQLVGFCVEGSKKALVYEFMPQGSLDRYIYENKEGASTSTNSSSSSTIPPLSWAKTLKVAIGIARGIENLHRGCSMKILHFDIKPQNVLLDTNFNPKVSDFGLAKSYPTEKNTVTVTVVRGTFGYMAPELFYASAGGVSSKSDVYSFGMLLMEMAGRRKNVHPDHAGSISNEGYLPTWIYHQLEQGKDIAVGGSNDEEKNIIYKMFMVALWCVQMKPVDRPSMGKVIEMLEGSAQQLQMPTGKPFLCSTDLVNFEDLVTTGSDSSEVSIVLPPHASA